MSHAIPRPEHPNPQFYRESWMNLNGEWEFYRDHGVSGKERKLYEAPSLPERITGPFCMESELSGIGDKDFCECVWYRREIDLPDGVSSIGTSAFAGCSGLTEIDLPGALTSIGANLYSSS